MSVPKTKKEVTLPDSQPQESVVLSSPSTSTRIGKAVFKGAAGALIGAAIGSQGGVASGVLGGMASVAGGAVGAIGGTVVGAKAGVAMMGGLDSPDRVLNIVYGGGGGAVVGFGVGGTAGFVAPILATAMGGGTTGALAMGATLGTLGAVYGYATA